MNSSNSIIKADFQRNIFKPFSLRIFIIIVYFKFEMLFCGRGTLRNNHRQEGQVCRPQGVHHRRSQEFRHEWRAQRHPEENLDLKWENAFKEKERSSLSGRIDESCIDRGGDKFFSNGYAIGSMFCAVAVANGIFTPIEVWSEFWQKLIVQMKGARRMHLNERNARSGGRSLALLRTASGPDVNRWPLPGTAGCRACR